MPILHLRVRCVLRLWVSRWLERGLRGRGRQSISFGWKLFLLAVLEPVKLFLFGSLHLSKSFVLSILAAEVSLAFFCSSIHKSSPGNPLPEKKSFIASEIIATSRLLLQSVSDSSLQRTPKGPSIYDMGKITRGILSRFRGKAGDVYQVAMEQDQKEVSPVTVESLTSNPAFLRISEGVNWDTLGDSTAPAPRTGRPSGIRMGASAYKMRALCVSRASSPQLKENQAPDDVDSAMQICATPDPGQPEFPDFQRTPAKMSSSAVTISPTPWIPGVVPVILPPAGFASSSQELKTAPKEPETNYREMSSTRKVHYAKRNPANLDQVNFWMGRMQQQLEDVQAQVREHDGRLEQVEDENEEFEAQLTAFGKKRKLATPGTAVGGSDTEYENDMELIPNGLTWEAMQHYGNKMNGAENIFKAAQAWDRACRVIADPSETSNRSQGRSEMHKICLKHLENGTPYSLMTASGLRKTLKRILSGQPVLFFAFKNYAPALLKAASEILKGEKDLVM